MNRRIPNINLTGFNPIGLRYILKYDCWSQILEVQLLKYAYNNIYIDYYLQFRIGLRYIIVILNCYRAYSLGTLEKIPYQKQNPFLA